MYFVCLDIGTYSALVLAAVLYLESLPFISRRHNLTADFLIVRLLHVLALERVSYSAFIKAFYKLGVVMPDCDLSI